MMQFKREKATNCPINGKANRWILSLGRHPTNKGVEKPLFHPLAESLNQSLKFAEIGSSTEDYYQRWQHKYVSVAVVVNI